MTRSRWRDPEYLSWWWHNRVSLDAKVVAAVIAIGLLGIGGYVAANGLEGSVAGSEADDADVQLVTTTVRKLVTVQEKARVVTTPALVIARRVDGTPVTNDVTQVRVETVPGEAGTRIVTEREVVPVVRQQRVTVDGGVRVRTVVQQAPGATDTQTVERVVDRVVERVVTQERPVTVVAQQTVTQIVAHTVTVDAPPVTVTAGPVTVTVTLQLPPVPKPRP